MTEQFSGIEPSRLIPGEFTGYRQFYLPFDSRKITSLNGTHWPVNGSLKAACIYLRVHTAPYRSCYCGIYNLNFPEQWYRVYSYDSTPLIDGVTKSSGKILFGTLGFRAEFSRIIAVCAPRKWLPPDLPTHIKVYSNKKDMWKEHPADNYSSLFDKATLKEITAARALYTEYMDRLREYEGLELMNDWKTRRFQWLRVPFNSR